MPSNLIGFIIGTEGRNIKAIEEASSANLSVSERNGPQSFNRNGRTSNLLAQAARWMRQRSFSSSTSSRQRSDPTVAAIIVPMEEAAADRGGAAAVEASRPGPGSRRQGLELKWSTRRTGAD